MRIGTLGAFSDIISEKLSIIRNTERCCFLFFKYYIQLSFGSVSDVEGE